MFRKITISAVSALVLASGAAFGEGAQTYVHDIDFAHEGVFGKFDKNHAAFVCVKGSSTQMPWIDLLAIVLL